MFGYNFFFFPTLRKLASLQLQHQSSSSLHLERLRKYKISMTHILTFITLSNHFTLFSWFPWCRSNVILLQESNQSSTSSTRSTLPPLLTFTSQHIFHPQVLSTSSSQLSVHIIKIFRLMDSFFSSIPRRRFSISRRFSVSSPKENSKSAE